MRYVQANGTTFTRHVIDNGEPTVWDENHNVRASKLTPEEATAFGVFKLKLTTPPFHNPLTQTRTDADAVLVGGVWTQNWVIADMPVDKAAEVLVSAKAAFILQVKAEAGQLTTQVLKGLESEYELAEKEAIAYKAAGYPATVPLSVADEVASKAAKGVTITATVACGNILAAATGWRTAQAALRRNRLTVTSAAEVAVDAAGLDVLKANWAKFLVAIRAQLQA